MVNPFDKYMGEVVARQAQAAARIAANAVKNRPTPNPWSSGAGAVAQAVNRVLPNPFDAPSGGGGGWSGGASSVGQAVARAVVEQAAPPPPPTPTIGQRIASQIVENAGRVAQREAVPAAPVADPRTPDGAPVFDWQPPQVRGLGETQGPPAPPEPRFFARPQGDIPDATDDLPAPDVTRQRPVEGPTLVAQDTGPRTASVQPLSAAVQQPARERTNEDVAVRGVRQTQATIGKSLAFADQEESPYVRVRSARTGQEYVVPRERAQNLGPGDEILGPADTQPESDRDRTAMGAEFLPTMRRTIGDLWSIVQYGGDQLINNPDTPIGRAVQNIRENGWGAVIPSYLDWADTGRVLNANNAIDAYIKLQMGDYDPSEEPVLLDAASLLTGALTTGAQAVLGNITITGSEEHGIETTGDVSFPEWHARTSVVVYEDGSTATVRNIDIENNPDKFENATVISNQDRAEAAYTEGIDTDGDGVADTFGADAVRQMYEADVSGVGMFVWQVGMDPLTYIPLVTTGGGRLANIGRARVANATSRTGVIGGRSVEILGRVIQRGSQALDEATSFGAGILLDRGVMPLSRKVGNVIGLGRESNASRQMTEASEAASTGAGIVTRADGTAPPLTGTAADTRSVDGGTPTETAAARTAANVEPQAGATSSLPDTRTPDGGDPFDATTRPPARTSQPTPEFDRGPDLRTPDGDTISTRAADGQGGTVERTITPDGDIEPIETAQTRVRTKTTMTPAGRVETSGIDRRYDRQIVRASAANGPGITQAAVDTMRAAGRFIDNTAMGQAIERELGTSLGTADHALNTASFAREWDDAIRAAGGTPTAFQKSNQWAFGYRNAEAIIHNPWGATSAQRNYLYRQPTSAPDAIRASIPANATPADLAAAERYADMVDAHQYWHPQDVADPGFQRAMAQADAIRKTLADMEYEGRPTGAVRRGSLIGSGQMPDTVSGDSTLRAGRDGGDGGYANASQGRRTDTGGEHDFGEVAGYPVVNERQGGRRGELYRRVQLDADTEVILAPVPEVEVPRDVRSQYPDAPQWFRASLVDDSVALDEVVRYAPDEDTAVRQVADEAQARGLLDDEAVTPTPADNAVPDAPDAVPSPDGQADTPPASLAPDAAPEPEAPPKRQTRSAQRAEEMRAAWGEIDPSNVSPSIQRALSGTGANKLIADGRTAVALEKVRVARNWTDDDMDLIIRALSDIRAAHGMDGPILTHADLANPATKQWLDEAETLARVEDAVRVHEGILRSTETTKEAKAGARKKLKQLEEERKKLRTDLGWRDPSQKTPNVRRQTTTEADAQSVLERVRPAGKREKKYISSLKKVQTLELGDMPVHNLTMDEHGMVRFHGAVLTDDELEVLTRHAFDDGDTFLDRWNRYLSEARGKRDVSLRDTRDDVGTALDMVMRDYEAMLKQRFPVRELPAILRGIQTYSRYLREKILGSWLSAPRYIGTQAFGNPMLMALGGYGDPQTLARMYAGVTRSYKETVEMSRLVGADVFDTSRGVMHADTLAHRWGTANAPEVRRHVSSGTDITKDYGVVEGYFRRHNIPGARMAGGVFGDTRVIRAGGAFDMAARDAVYASAFERRVKESITDFQIDTTKMLMDAGLSRREAVDALNTFRRTHPDGFTSNDVRTFFGRYVPDGKAERLARDWQSRINATNRHARSEVSRVLFAGKETKADALLKSVVMFHYFMSRQYFYLIRQSLHHPGLINAYVAYQEMMGDYYEQHQDQIPEWLQGYMRFALGGPFGGFALFMNPSSLLSVGNIFGDPDMDWGDDKTWLQEMLDRGGEFLFLSPLVTDALNIAGFLGDDRNVDPLRLQREVEVFNLGINWGIETGWIRGVDSRMSNPVLDFGNFIRSKVSSLGLPGQEEQAFVSTGEAEIRQRNAAIVMEAEAAGIDPTTPEGQSEIDAILDDPTHPIYKAGMRRYLWGETANIGARLIPGLASQRPQVRPTNAEDQDLFTNTTPEQRRLINTTNPEARALRTQEQSYYSIGDDNRAAGVADRVYNDVAYADEVFFDVTVDGVTYTHDEIEKMDREERGKLARAWLAEHGLYRTWQQTKDAQDQFLAQPENADFATFKRWQGEVYDYPGGVDAYWQQLISENENARQYYEHLDEKLPENQRQQALTSKYAYMAVRGIPVGWAQSQDGEWYQLSSYDSPAPKPTNDYDPVDIANKPPAPTPYEPYTSPYEEQLRKDVDNYQRYRARDEVVLQQIYRDWNMSPDTRLGVVPYKTRKAIEKEFTARTGEYITKPSHAAEDYFQWVDENPGRSLDDYILWSNNRYIRGLPEAWTEEYNRPAEGKDRDLDGYRYYDSDEYRGD